MFCPNCGTKTEAGQKYCRACGLSVEKLAGLISEQLPAGALEGSTPEEVARLLRRKHGVERLLVGIGLTAGSVFVISLMVMIVVKIHRQGSSSTGRLPPCLHPRRGRLAGARLLPRDADRVAGRARGDGRDGEAT